MNDKDKNILSRLILWITTYWKYQDKFSKVCIVISAICIIFITIFFIWFALKVQSVNVYLE